MLESTREKEAAVKRETTEQLEFFRKQQEEADRALLSKESLADETKEEGKAGSPTQGQNQWAVNARKRKRASEKEGLKGLKLRKTSTSEAPVTFPANAQKSEETIKKSPTITNKTTEPQNRSKDTPLHTTAVEDSIAPSRNPKSTAQPGLGLGGYSSDEED